MSKVRSQGATFGVYFKDDIVRFHRDHVGRRYYVPRTAPDGTDYRDVYVIPESLTAFARDSMIFTISLVGTWQEITTDAAPAG
jgi:hypothetical protein